MPRTFDELAIRRRLHEPMSMEESRWRRRRRHFQLERRSAVVIAAVIAADVLIAVFR